MTSRNCRIESAMLAYAWSDAEEALTVTGLDLGINLDTAIRRNHVVGNRHPLVNGDTLVNNSIVLHVGHAEHPVNLCDAEPVQDVRHEGLETHVFNAGNVLSSLKVLASTIFSSLSRVVDEILGHFTQSTALLSEVDDHTTAALLGFLDGLFNTKRQVWAACADVGAEDVASITFIVNTKSESGAGIGHLCWVTEDVDGQTADGWEEELDIVTGDELWVGTTSLLEQCSA